MENIMNDALSVRMISVSLLHITVLRKNFVNYFWLTYWEDCNIK